MNMEPYNPGPPARVIPRNPALAIVVSAFVPGLGSAINGRIAKGIGIQVCFIVACVSCLIAVGFVLAPAVWVWGMVAANNDVKRWNLDHGIVS